MFIFELLRCKILCRLPHWLHSGYNNIIKQQIRKERHMRSNSSSREISLKQMITCILLGIIAPLVITMMVSKSYAAALGGQADSAVITNIIVSEKANSAGYVLFPKTTLPSNAKNIYVTVGVKNTTPGTGVSVTLIGPSK